MFILNSECQHVLSYHLKIDKEDKQTTERSIVLVAKMDNLFIRNEATFKISKTRTFQKSNENITLKLHSITKFNNTLKEIFF